MVLNSSQYYELSQFDHPLDLLSINDNSDQTPRIAVVGLKVQ